MTLKKYREGESYINTNGEYATIIEYISATNITVKFNCGVIVRNNSFSDLKKGTFRNPFRKSFYGVGFLGEGHFNTVKHRKYCDLWVRMLQRCYDDKYHISYPTYKGVTVCEDWHNFQNFSKWCEEKYIKDFHLDKDILFKNSKRYSPKTCCFVPREVNVIFTKRQALRGKYPIGVHLANNKIKSGISINGKTIHLGYYSSVEEAFEAYKEAKEKYIKEVADKWKDRIDLRVYQAMYNYKVEITD